MRSAFSPSVDSDVSTPIAGTRSATGTERGTAGPVVFEGAATGTPGPGFGTVGGDGGATRTDVRAVPPGEPDSSGPGTPRSAELCAGDGAGRRSSGWRGDASCGVPALPVPGLDTPEDAPPTPPAAGGVSCAATGPGSGTWWPRRPIVIHPRAVSSRTSAITGHVLDWRLRCLAKFMGYRPAWWRPPGPWLGRRRRRVSGIIAIPAPANARAPRPISVLSPECDAPPAPVSG